VGPTIFLFFPFILFPIPPTHHPRRICPRRPRRDSPTPVAIPPTTAALGLSRARRERVCTPRRRHPAGRRSSRPPAPRIPPHPRRISPAGANDPSASFPRFFASERALRVEQARHEAARRQGHPPCDDVLAAVPRGISSGVRPPRPTPPAKKQRPAAAPHPRPTGPPPAAHPRPTAPPLGDGLRRRQEEPSRRPNAVLFPGGPPPCIPHA
jgi:hypothetical protein